MLGFLVRVCSTARVRLDFIGVGVEVRPSIMCLNGEAVRRIVVQSKTKALAEFEKSISFWVLCARIGHFIHKKIVTLYNVEVYN